MSSEHIIEVFLLITVVFALSCDVHRELAGVEGATLHRVAYNDCCVIDAKKQPAIVAPPPWIAFSLRKVKNLEGVLIGICEVKRLDPRWLFIPCRQSLRSAGNM